MSKLSLEALRLRAKAVASEDLLATISGGMENACHDGSSSVRFNPSKPSFPPPVVVCDNI